MGTNKDLLYSPGKSAQVMWQSGWDGSLGENGYMSPLYCAPKTITMLFIGYTSV